VAPDRGMMVAEGTNHVSAPPIRPRRPGLPATAPVATAPTEPEAPAPSAPEGRGAGATAAHVEREEERLPLDAGFEARDGDTLVVTYPEVTLPLPAKFAMMKFGGLIYTRKLRAGDDVAAEHARIDRWLSRTAETEGTRKYKRLVREFVRSGGNG
jgi:hypothetical protein